MRTKIDIAHLIQAANALEVAALHDQATVIVLRYHGVVLGYAGFLPLTAVEGDLIVLWG